LFWSALMIDLPLLFAFSAGMVAAFNPCGAAMFPAYVGYQLSGDSNRNNLLVDSFRAILVGLVTTAGFIIVFGIVGLIVAAGGSVIGQYLPLAGLLVGIIITAFGISLIAFKKKLGFIAASRVNLGQGKGIRNVFLFGVGYAVASVSCALPIFLAAVGIVTGKAVTTYSVVETIISSLSYGVGMGVVMIAVAIGAVFFKELVRKILRKVFPLVEPVGNLAMVGAGVYLIYYWSIGDGSDLLFLRLEQIF
jgi:cytochrome c-type biogenesis protein